MTESFVSGKKNHFYSKLSSKEEKGAPSFSRRGRRHPLRPVRKRGREKGDMEGYSSPGKMKKEEKRGKGGAPAFVYRKKRS